MYRGTTPTIAFKIDSDIDLETMTRCCITFENSYKTKTKTYELDDLTVDAENSSIYLELSQEDTLYFDAGKIKVQIRIKLEEDDKEKIYASDVKTINVTNILKDGAI